MPRFLVERQFEVGQEQMDAVGRRSREIAEESYPTIVWEHSHVAVGEDGRVQTFCLYEAPEAEVIHQHAQELGLHQIVRVTEIVGDVTPADFPG
ncbi:MAG TPA: nickel-binding protein [Solirubrobacteraceae bacterium]|nr:nickel-binding protein [Solirubrobacteraceae bacterium]